jgi:plasmid stability protein
VSNVLIRDVPLATLAALKERARRHGRSLQQELATLLDKAARQVLQPSPDAVAATIRARLAREGRTFTDGTLMVREDRER